MKKMLWLFCLTVRCLFIQAQTVSKDLNANWTFRRAQSPTWFKATVPGTVHTDLMANKIIPDPYYRDNEKKVQWVSQDDWEYKGTFTSDSNLLQKNHIELVFEGLDTYADVYLNNHLILQANNMFRTWRIDVKPFLQKQNTITVYFKSAERIADSLAKASPLNHPSDNSRNYVRKAQYHFGWDWGPKFVTCGIWRKITLNSWNEESEHQEAPFQKTDNHIQLIQEPDSIGQSFYFTVNRKPTFIKGANWIPADMFLPRITHAKYRELLTTAKEAGINMLRVWGGGIYEDDYFYTLCDSLGIMVWQDFMFACAMYPGDDAFIENVKQEAIDNIKRLRVHPCIAVWCGNNEVDEGWNNWEWKKQFLAKPEDSIKVWNEYKKLFHELLPQLVKELDGRPYITTSPAVSWTKKESLTAADCHYWGVWWGLEPIETYAQKVPRFMSEYGMQAMPNWETIEKFSVKEDWDTSSDVMKVHQKHPTGYKNLAVYLEQNNLHPKTFQEYVTATQEVQSRALRIAITAHIAAQPNCMGTIFWQFNDCWPVASWSILDYYGGKKKAFYTVKELYRGEKK